MTLLHVLLGLGLVSLLGAAALLWSVVALVWFAGVGGERAGRRAARSRAAAGKAAL
jgi:hypothetical protein